jgi:G2/mitotic-specific cyclin 3/4
MTSKNNVSNTSSQPIRSRAMRVHDENMVPPVINGAVKTLHQRTKSVPAFSTLYQADAVKAANKKVLGDANTNLRITQPSKDDSVLDKKAGTGIVKPTAAFARPATRPVHTKSVSAQNVPTTSASILPVTSKGLSQISELATEQPKKLLVKKSTRVLKTADTVLQSETETKKPASHLSLLPEQDGGVPLPRQEVRKTETVPLRDEVAPRATSTGIPAGFTSSEEYMMYLETQTNLPSAHVGGAVNILPSNATSAEQYYDEDDGDYYYEDGYSTIATAHGESTGGVTTVLVPLNSRKVEQDLQVARLHVESTRTPEDIEDEQWDTSMVAEYGDEIFGYMKSLEQRMAPNPRYMEQQQEIQWSMRAVLIDWVVQVHSRFSLLPETLFLTVNYIDRFLSCKIVSLAKLQLVGATALFVAAKYEEVNCPTISEIIYMVDGGYSVEELLKAERFMLSMLQFELGWPGPMSFLRRISKADDYCLETRTLAKYFLEITIMDERMVGCAPSFTAAGAHCMARLMLGKGEWSLAHTHFSGYTYAQLRQLLQTILDCCEDPRKHHSAVFEKYADKRFKKSSLFVEEQMALGFALTKLPKGVVVDNVTIAQFLK